MFSVAVVVGDVGLTVTLGVRLRVGGLVVVLDIVADSITVPVKPPPPVTCIELPILFCP